MAFQGSWRTYQRELLGAVDGHLADRKLHIVAAPGSGKTLIGLEVLRRIGHPAIVLAPTLAIRNQWIERLCAMFLPPGATEPEWISTSLDDPRPLTLLTYQVLHAATQDGAAEQEPAPDDAETETVSPGRIENLIGYFRTLGATTLVFDEAHHLRREWWKALTGLHAALPDAQIVSLTATPPYDVEAGEWQRYETLCGPIDAEVPVPQLVQSGDLCPHQDYLHISLPAASEEALIAAHRGALQAFLATLLDDARLRVAIEQHPWLLLPQDHEEAILEAPELLSAMLIYLRAARAPLPHAPLRLLGARAGEMPAMSLYWLEILLDGIAFERTGEFGWDPVLVKQLRGELRRLGTIEGKRVRLREGEAFYSTLAGSLAKIGSTVEIARAEAGHRGEGLRMVVLADYVRAADLPRSADAGFRPAKLGVVPIFEALRRAALPGVRLGVLTGSLVIVPAAAMPALERAAAQAGVAASELRAAPLAHDPAFVRVELAGAERHRMVQLVTRLFGEGEVNLLAGTQALLGEGWDAPTVNTLVLASYVGSYMLSNQMRGRAIRSDAANPHKAANIWHLATVTPDTIGTALARRTGWAPPIGALDPIGVELGADMAMLKRRFRAFEGVDHGSARRIETGIERLHLDRRDWSPEGIAALNAEMVARAEQRETLAERWQGAIGAPAERRRMRQVTRAHYAPRQVAFTATLEHLATTSLIGGGLFAMNALVKLGLPSGFFYGALLFGGLVLLRALPRLGKAGYLLARNGTLERSIAALGHAVVEGLGAAGQLAGTPEIAVVAERSVLGVWLIHVEGAGARDERIVLGALGEVLGPIGNPRYLIVRKSALGRLLRTDYHAVPALLGQRREDAEYFAERWRALVGEGELLYVRSGAGRRMLLRARARSLSGGLRRSVDTFTAWR